MEKRVFLAIALSFFVLLAYSKIVPPPQPTVAQPQILEGEPAAASAALSSLSSVSPASPIQKPTALLVGQGQWQKFDITVDNLLVDNELHVYEDDYAEYRFSRRGGFLVEVFDKAHATTISIRNIGLVQAWTDILFEANPLSDGVEFDVSVEDGTRITKTFRVVSPYTIAFRARVESITSYATGSYNILVGFMDRAAVADPISQRYFEVSALANNVVTRKPAQKIKKFMDFGDNVEWAGLRDRYYGAVVLPLDVTTSFSANSYDKKISLNLIPQLGRPGSSVAPASYGYNIYIGPQDEKLLRGFHPGAERIINFGFFDSISKALLFVLSGIHKATRSWGWSIILFTILLYIVLFPLSSKSMMSMKKMQALQPKVEELRAKFKDAPQKMNVEVMALYRRERVNPLGGCLPMLLQIPVFFSLYQVLMRFISLKGTPFLWIKDLAAPDRLLVLGKEFPIIGNEFNILPLLMGGVMFLQQKFFSPSASSSASSSASDQQKMMTIIMPVLFCFLFYKLPSGLVLYWFTNSLLMFGFQWRISKTAP